MKKSKENTFLCAIIYKVCYNINDFCFDVNYCTNKEWINKYEEAGGTY